MPRSSQIGRQTGRLVSIWTVVDGLRIHARVSADPLPPDAPVIVLVHGAAVSHRYLLPIARHLAPRARVYVPDLPGYGLSDKPPVGDLQIWELANWLAAWMDAVGLDSTSAIFVPRPEPVYQGTPEVTATRRGGTFRSFFAVVQATTPAKVAAPPYLDLVTSVKNGGSRG